MKEIYTNLVVGQSVHVAQEKDKINKKIKTINHKIQDLSALENVEIKPVLIKEKDEGVKAINIHQKKILYSFKSRQRNSQETQDNPALYTVHKGKNINTER